MKQGVRGALVAGFLLIAFVLLAGFHWSKPRILILHSFDQTVRSVVKTNEGINRILASNRQPVSLRWHYLEMNRLPEEPERQLASAAAVSSIEQFDPDITLLSARGGQAANIAVLTSRTPTGMSRLHQIESFNWAPHKVAAIHALQDFALWQDVVNKMAENVDVILVLSHHGLQVSKTDAALASGAEITRWLNEHARPLSIGASPEFVKEGGVLAVYPSGEEMGELAAVYALDWIKARSRKDLPLTESAHFRVGLRESMHSERKLMLPKIYREAAYLENLYYP